MEPRWPMLVALGVSLYAAFLLTTAPAAAVAWALNAMTRNMLSLEAAEGGAWHGRAAALVVTLPGAPPHRLREVRWELLPSRLLLGRLAAALSLEDDRVQGAATLQWQPHRLVIAASAITVSAAGATSFFPVLQLVRPGGELKLRADELIIAEGAVRGQAQLEWADASSALSAIKPLGTYRALLKGNGAGAEFEVTTAKGVLQVDGRGAWTPGTRPIFSGTAKPQPARAAELREFLKLLGAEDENGTFRLRSGPV